MFILNLQLKNDTIFLGELTLCSVLLMNNAKFPWVILVPKRLDAVEIIDLPQDERTILMEEISQVSKVIKETYWPDKINIAALGNIVPQLHVHIIARFKTDDVWPDPVWGKGSKPYSENGIIETTEILRRELKKIDSFHTVANEP
ncbi:MAG: histidine triad protein [Rickettsiaceae bacterium]|jgi:diadenosine tetraphosphate (Ap4A) HIT family hydrolase|nr:histidine triad protein [Rickettsiaceae bacterium]